MSATNRGTQTRDPEDFYRTPDECVETIWPHLQLGHAARIVDAGCGDGAILSVVARLGVRTHKLTGVELNGGRAERARALEIPGAAIVCADYLTWGESQAIRYRGGPKPFDLAIGNPPYSLAMDFVQAPLKIADTVAMLLRLPWLASQGRADWLRAHTPSVYVLPKRPEFVMSVKCVKLAARKRGEKNQEPIPFKGECSYQEYRPMAAERPRACPLCGSKVTIITSDATDYGWFLWGGRRQAFVHIL